jgi:hypothetical protein
MLINNELHLTPTKLNSVCNGWRAVDYFGSRARVLVQFTEQGEWQQFDQRQLLEGNNWKSSYTK